MSVKGLGREIKSGLHIEKRNIPNVFTAEKPSPVGSHGSSEEVASWPQMGGFSKDESWILAPISIAL